MGVRVAKATLLLAVLAAATIGVSAGAQNNASAKIPIAFVDLDRVLDEYQQANVLRKDLQTYSENLQKQLDNLRAARLLDDKDRQEMEALLKLPSPTDEQKKRIQALADIEAQREAEMATLSAKEPKTDAEKARHTQLLNLLNAQNRRAQELNRQLTAEMDQKIKETDDKVRKAILDAVNAVADEKGIDIVIDKKAVLRGGQDRDITDAVLKKLNGSTPTPSQ
jgi:Skp family chaperone for outer membrane proteins